ncbi:uncharacterized protein [Channa argus]|uniref:uncharacterized protein isoform X2 n=1 Tax=Channa argus TaxID=215402 RepID=UPI0035214609
MVLQTAPFLVFCACIVGLFHVGATPDTLSSLDSSFCHGGLEVIYPELDIDKCMIIPKDLREKLSTVWKSPQIYFSGAQKKQLYVLVMVDPDAPSHAHPTSAFWRHWLIVDIQYFAPRGGNICLASEWSLAVQFGAGRGAHCSPANDESVCPLSWRRRKLLLHARSLHSYAQGNRFPNICINNGP